MNTTKIIGIGLVCMLGLQAAGPVSAQESLVSSYGQQAAQLGKSKVPSKQSAGLKEPQLKADFSNVINFKQYTGFTKGQLDLLRQNGFVVMAQPEQMPFLKMYQPYEEAEYGHTPILITTDAVFNLYHIFYGDSLKILETSQLQGHLKNFSSQMLKDSLKSYQNSRTPEEKTQLKTIAAYYTVAASLLGEKPAVPEEIQALADGELALIQKAAGQEMSPLLDRKMDYSQYAVRGHYTTSQTLTQYFKAMMWYGQIGFALTDEYGQPDLAQTRLALRMSLMAKNNAKAYALWEKVYAATSSYVGTSDDLSLTELNQLADQVFGSQEALAALNDPKYDQALAAGVKALPEPKIVPHLIDTSDAALRKQFRVMGQRYTLDADVMQQLIYPVVRPESSGLDVMAALGSERAKVLAEKYENPNAWKDYSSKLETAKAQVAALDEASWQNSLYNGWLWAMKAQVQSFEKNPNMPRFMQTKAWTDKSLITALGSYAELKHDTVLYNKQACAERGGPEEKLPYLYVEPNTQVYARLLTLTVSTKKALKETGTLDADIAQILDEMTLYLQTMKTCSEKELKGQLFTQKEYDTLKTFGGMVDHVSNQLLNKNRQYDGSINVSFSSALISDVSNIQDTGECVELATGIPHTIYAICPYNGKLFLAEGTTFSYYEFASKDRLTDEAWQEMLGIHKVTNQEYGYSYVQYDPQAKGYQAYAPMWTASYFSKEANYVKTNDIEVNWNGTFKS